MYWLKKLELEILQEVKEDEVALFDYIQNDESSDNFFGIVWELSDRIEQNKSFAIRIQSFINSEIDQDEKVRWDLIDND